MMRKLTQNESPTERADELFRQQQNEIYIKTDQLLAKLMFWQWIACILMAVIISPYTWSGETNAIHIHVWAAIFLGGALSVFPIWLTRVWPGAAITRYVIAVAQMLMSALLISITGGRIETHFHVFGSLVILSFYRDWRVLVPATIVVALDHFIRGVYWPYSVYGVLTATPWRSIEHAAWVVFEDVFLVISCLRSIGEMRSIANRTAALEASEKNFREIFEGAPIGVAVADFNYRFLQVNPALCEMTGYSAEELKQRKTLDITFPEDVDLTTQIAQAMLKGRSRDSFEKRYVRKNKEVFWTACTVSLVCDKNGKPLHVLGMIQDISERKRAEEEIQQLNQVLEQRVQQRTVGLQTANHHLQCEVAERKRAEKSLRTSEERFRSLVQSANYGIILADDRGDIISWNNGAQTIFGYCEEEALGKPLGMLMPERYRQAHGKGMERFQATGEGRVIGKTVELEGLRKDGSEFPLDLSLAAWRTEAGMFFSGIIRDTTERKQAEEALRQAEQKYRAIFENAAEGIFQTTPDGKYLSVNPAMARLFGYDSPEELKTTVTDIGRLFYIDPERREEFKRLIEEQGSVERFEYQVRRKDGNTMWLTEDARAVRDANGTVIYYEGAMRDITERKQAEDALRQTEQKYRAIFENATEGIFQTTPDGRYISVNPALARIYGYDSPEELAASVTDIGGSIYVDPKRRAEFKRLIETKGSVELFEYEVFRKDGSKIWLCENARAVRDANGVIMYYEGSVEDITERKLVDEVKRASKAKSEFLSRMSHELRTPLNAILGFGQLLERQKPTEVQRKRIGYILSAGKHLLDLINEVLDISRIEAGRMQLSLEPVSVADALEEALDLMRPLAAERTIQLSASVDIDAGVHVLADRQRFKQVLLNLLNNAVKYTPFCGGVTVSYNVNGNDKIRVLVSDTGPGIPPEKLTRLFTPFERLGAEQSAIEGTGLGLALSQRLMQAMDGSIGADSAVGKGSTFWIELPRTKSPLEQLPVRNEANGARESTSQSRVRSILYIEDNLSNLALIEQMLAERPGTALLTTMQGKVGLDLARQHSPDLILLDLHLPDLPGWNVLSQLKANATTRDIPVVVISADATKRQINHLMAAGAAHYLTKPLDVTKFFRVLDETTDIGGTKLSAEAISNGEVKEACQST